MTLCTIQLESLLRTWPHTCPAEPAELIPSSLSGLLPSKWFATAALATEGSLITVSTDVEQCDPLAAALVQSVALTIFLVCHTDRPFTKRTSGDASKPQSSAQVSSEQFEPISELTSMALSLAYGLVAVIMKNCVDTRKRLRWLGAIATFTEFLSYHPRFAQIGVRACVIVLVRVISCTCERLCSCPQASANSGFYEHLAKLLNVLQPQYISVVDRVCETSRRCIPPPMLATGTPLPTASPIAGADGSVDGDEGDDDDNASKTASTTSVGDLSSRDSHDIDGESGVSNDDSDGGSDGDGDGDDNSDGDGATDASDDTDVDDVVSNASSPDDAPVVTDGAAAAIHTTTAVPVPVTALTPLTPIALNAVPAEPESPAPARKFRGLKRDDVLEAMADAVLLEDFELAGFAPFSPVLAGRAVEVEKFRARCGVSAGVSLATFFRSTAAGCGVGGDADFDVSPCRDCRCMTIVLWCCERCCFRGEAMCCLLICDDCCCCCRCACALVKCVLCVCTASALRKPPAVLWRTKTTARCTTTKTLLFSRPVPPSPPQQMCWIGVT